jgi:hypothetical protein
MYSLGCIVLRDDRRHAALRARGGGRPWMNRARLGAGAALPTTGVPEPLRALVARMLARARPSGRSPWPSCARRVLFHRGAGLAPVSEWRCSRRWLPPRRGAPPSPPVGAGPGGGRPTGRAVARPGPGGRTDHYSGSSLEVQPAGAAPALAAAGGAALALAGVAGAW